MRQYASDFAFTPAVKGIQEKKGSRRGYARMEQDGGWRTTVTPDLAQFLAGLDMFYLATASAAGQPYIQYRGGPPGFLKVLERLSDPEYPGKAERPSASPSRPGTSTAPGTSTRDTPSDRSAPPSRSSRPVSASWKRSWRG